MEDRRAPPRELLLFANKRDSPDGAGSHIHRGAREANGVEGFACQNRNRHRNRDSTQDWPRTARGVLAFAESAGTHILCAVRA
jgi:hypothetical protein